MLFVVPRGLLCALRGFLFVSLLCPLLPCPHGSLYRIHNLLQTRRTPIPKLKKSAPDPHTRRCCCCAWSFRSERVRNHKKTIDSESCVMNK